MRDDRRGPRDRHAGEVLRVGVATALSVPVIGLIIGESLVRRLGRSRPALLSVGLLAGTIAISVLTTVPIGARSSTTAPPIADREFLAIPNPAPTIRATEPVARSLARSSSEPLEVALAPEAPAIVRFVGGTPADAIAFTRLMERITLAKNSAYGLPSLGFSGTPTGIDARLVVETGVAPGAS